MYQSLRGLPYEDLDLENGIPIVELLRRAWRMFFSDGNIFVYYLVFVAVLMGASMVPAGSLIVTGPMLAGVSYVYLKVARREKVAISNLFDGFSLFGQTLATYLLFALIMFGGVLLCFVGAIIFSIWYFFLWYLIADGEREIWPAFVKSKELISGFGWEIFLFMLVSGLFNMAGVLVCFVGVMVTAPITMLATAMLFDLLCAHKGYGIRNPQYVEQYWAGEPKVPPVVGPLDASGGQPPAAAPTTHEE